MCLNCRGVGGGRRNASILPRIPLPLPYCLNSFFRPSPLPTANCKLQSLIDEQGFTHLFAFNNFVCRWLYVYRAEIDEKSTKIVHRRQVTLPFSRSKPGSRSSSMRFLRTDRRLQSRGSRRRAMTSQSRASTAAMTSSTSASACRLVSLQTVVAATGPNSKREDFTPFNPPKSRTKYITNYRRICTVNKPHLHLSAHAQVKRKRLVKTQAMLCGLWV